MESPSENQPAEPISSPFRITGRILGRGATGTVRLAVDAHAPASAVPTKFAVKIVSKSQKACLEEAVHEIQMLRQLRHENIMQIMCIEEDLNHLYVYSEFMDQGDLFSWIGRCGPCDEDRAGILFAQMVSALKYIHDQRICHHDFKLENCVINRRLELRVIDFAYAMNLEDDVPITRFPGSPAYSAPEVLFRKPHTETVDVFALGTSLFYLLAGRFPFCDVETSSMDELCKNVSSFNLQFPEHLSDDVQHLICRMLAKPESRADWQEILSHPWLTARPADTDSDCSACGCCHPTDAPAPPRLFVEVPRPTASDSTEESLLNLPPGSPSVPLMSRWVPPTSPLIVHESKRARSSTLPTTMLPPALPPPAAPRLNSSAAL